MNTHETGYQATGIDTDRSSLWAWTLACGLATLCVALIAGAGGVAAQEVPLAASMDNGWQGYEQQPIRVNIWHDKDEDEVYRKGESVRVHFETNHDAYAVVYMIDAEGEVEILWPRSRLDDGFVFANHTYNLPSPGGRRIRTAGQEGVEYVQAIVSAYPFDLRGLDIDFLHEPSEVPRSYFVAGDPFLAMNDINFEVTGLEDTEDFVVTNYTSWYVSRPVDHPRYLCGQCHNDAVGYHPYRDSCTIEIHHNYGWANDWYVSYGYYPAYYYPVYYYVDPWTSRPWVNYWYRPWYRWPTVSYGWGFDCYVWNYSPYWHGDVWGCYNDGNRRYRPLGKGVRYKAVKEGADYRHPRGLVKTPRPSQDMRTAMESRVASSRIKGDRTQPAARPDRDGFRDVGRSRREHQNLTRTGNDERRTGIRVPDTRYPSTIGSGAVRSQQTPTRSGEPRVRGEGRSDTGGERAVRPSPGRTPNTESTRVRPVEPRSKGSRIWRGGSTNQQQERTVEPRPVQPRREGGSRTPAVRPRSNDKPKRTHPTVRPVPRSNQRSQTPRPAVRPTPRSNKGSGSTPRVQPSRGNSSGSSSGSKGSKGSQSRGSGGSKSGGGKTKKR